MFLGKTLAAYLPAANLYLRYLAVAVILGLSGVVNAGPPVGEPAPVTAVNVPASDADGSYTISVVAPRDYEVSSYFDLDESKDGGTYHNIASPTANTPGFSHAVSGRDSGVYKYRAQRCINYTGECSSWTYSGNISVVRKPKTPGTISFTNVTSGTTDREGEFKVSWVKSITPPKVTGYRVERKKLGCNPACSWTGIYQENSTSNGPIDAHSGNALPNGQYQFQVRAFVKVGTSTVWSDWRTPSTTITVNRAPDQVDAITQPTGTQGLTFQVKWSGNAASGGGDPLQYYKLEMHPEGKSYGCGSDCKSWNVAGPVGSPETEKEVTVVDSGKYYFRVSACNDGCGPPSPDKQVLVYIPPESPGPPSFVNYPKSSDEGDYTIQWSAPTSGDFTYFKLYQKRRHDPVTQCAAPNQFDASDSLCWRLVDGNISKTTTSYPFGGEVADEYNYRLAACNTGDSYCAWDNGDNWIAVHNLENIVPAVTADDTTQQAGSLPYNASVSPAGDAMIQIPMQLVPGVNGLLPQVSLRYSGARYRERINEVLPEDIMGYGWRLGGFGEIRRCVKNRSSDDSIQLDNTDFLCLNGEPLVAVEGQYWAESSKYRTLRDSFHLVELQKTDGKTWFRVHSPDGNTSEYGNTENSRLRVGVSEHFAWSLNRVTDPFNNTVEYRYHRDTLEGINYPLEIIYGDNGDARIEFQYGTRTDAPPQPLGPDEIQQQQLVLLHHINIYRNWNGSSGDKMREYRLITEEEPENPDETPHFRRLKQVQMCGFEEDDTGMDPLNPICLRPLVFDWITPQGENPIEFKTGIKQVSDGLGKSTVFKHTMMYDDGSTAGQLDTSESPFGEAGVPDSTPLEAVDKDGDGIGEYRCVVTELWRSNGYEGDGTEFSTEWHKTYYAYLGTGLESTKNWGFLGYPAQKITDGESGIVTYRQFRLDFPHFGQTARVLQYDYSYPIGAPLIARRFRYGSLTLDAGDGTTYYPVLEQSLETVYEGSQIVGYHLNTNTHTKLAYDGGGDLIQKVEHIQRTATGASYSTTQSIWGEVEAASVSGVQRSTKTITTFNNRTSPWLMGFAEKTEVYHYRGNTDIAADREQIVEAAPLSSSNKIDYLRRYPNDTTHDLKIDYSYDPNTGNLLSETTSSAASDAGVEIASRNVTVGSYIANRYPHEMTNALGQSITVDYDLRFGKPKTITDANNRVTEITYDSFGREDFRTSADGVTFDTDYDRCGSVACPTVLGIPAAYRVLSNSPITPKTERYYDILGRLVQLDTQSFDGSIARREYGYDRQGRMEMETAPFFENGHKPITGYEYDLRNRLKKIEKPGDGQIVIGYAAVGDQVQVEEKEFVYDSELNEQIQIKRSLYNLMGDLVKVVDAAETAKAVTTAYAYYGDGQPETVKVAEGTGLQTLTQFFYDRAGNRETLIDPNLGTVGTVYDALGQLRSQTDNKNQTITYLYDKLGRLTDQIEPDGQTQWIYDPLNSIGSLNSRSYTQGTTTQFSEIYLYREEDSKLDGTLTTLDAGGEIREYTHGYGYDTFGRLNEVIYPGGQAAAKYQYQSGSGYLEAITDYGGTPLKTFNTLNALGQVEEEVYGNSVITNRNYNPDTGRLETIDTIGATQIQDNGYNWYSNGNLESRLAQSAGETEKLETFQYDALNRLEESSTTLDSGARSLSTAYNLLGNITGKTSSHSADTQVSGYQYGQNNAGPNAVSSVTINGEAYSLNYDANGAITHYDAAMNDDKWITWNSRQLPTKILVGDSQSTETPTALEKFQYGPNGQRYYRETSWWDQDQQQLLTEKVFIVGNYEDQYPANDPDYQRIQKTRIDSNVLHILASNAVGDEQHYRYLHRDHLGSIEKVTDGNGNLLIDSKGTRAYDPYGARRKADWSGELSEQELDELLSSVGLSTQRGFTDHEHLDRTGLIHMNGRIYDPTLGRFLSPDPFVQAPTNSQSWNRYSYVVNSPLSLSDPSGYIFSCGGGDYYWQSCDYWFYEFLYESEYGRGGGGGGADWSYCYYGNPSCRDPEERRAEEQERQAALQMEKDTAKAQGRAAAGGREETILENISEANYFLGSSALLVEYAPGSVRFTKAGSISPKYYRSGWAGGGSARITTHSLRTIGAGLGRISIAVGITADAIGVGVYLYDPENSYATSPGKGTLNISMAAVSYYNPPVGIAYFGVDLFYPGGWPGAMESNDRFAAVNRRILGDSWNPHRLPGGLR